jgi:hypothetical protein
VAERGDGTRMLAGAGIALATMACALVVGGWLRGRTRAASDGVDVTALLARVEALEQRGRGRASTTHGDDDGLATDVAGDLAGGVDSLRRAVAPLLETQLDYRIGSLERWAAALSRGQMIPFVDVCRPWDVTAVYDVGGQGLDGIPDRPAVWARLVLQGSGGAAVLKDGLPHGDYGKWEWTGRGLLVTFPPDVPHIGGSRLLFREAAADLIGMTQFAIRAPREGGGESVVHLTRVHRYDAGLVSLRKFLRDRYIYSHGDAFTAGDPSKP